MKNNPIPWHLIGELAKRGESVKALAVKFNLPEERIQKRLNLALASNGHVRSNLEIKHAGDQVKSDLVSVLAKLAANLASKKNLEPKADSAELCKLIDASAKLFSWPNPKPVDQNALLNPHLLTPAINLALIRTTPEQLRAKARDIDSQAS